MSTIARKALLLFVIVLSPVLSFALTASFTAEHLSGCCPLVVNFTNTSTGATSYSWDLGNGTHSSVTNASGSYITPGTYTVILTAYNGSSSTTHTITITVYPSPTVSFYATDTAICPGTSTTFISTSTPGVSGPVTYLWSFGDGSSSTVASPGHVYTTPGYYNVTLVVTNSEGCSSSLTVGAYIFVYNHSSIAFSSSPSYFCSAPGMANFTSSITGAGPYTYAWSFGDGSTSTAANPSHTYAATGAYSVSLVITDVNGCIDSLVRSSYINITSMTSVISAPTTVCCNSWAYFSNTSSTHTSCSWSFGDGGSATTDTCYHYYSTPGTYNVRLIIHNGPCSDTAYQSVTVLPIPSISFTVSPSDPCPAPVNATLTASVPSGSTVAWRFGDGTTGSGTSTTHTYSSNGVYYDTMTVTTSGGCVARLIQPYIIHDMILRVIPDSTSGCVPLHVTFFNNLATTIPGVGPYPDSVTSWTWTFGDGSAGSSARTPTHIYTASGVYTARVTETTTNGCTISDSLIISVGTIPTVTATDTPSHICFGRSVSFLGHVTAGGPVNQWFWEWGDGTSETDSMYYTSHAFVLPGTDTVRLIAYNNGCPSAPVYLYPIIIDSPMARIASAYNCIPYNKVTYVDHSYGDDTHTWYFGDGTSSTADSINHTYPGFTTYTCTLVTYNIRSGCHDTATVSVDLVPPVVNLLASDSVICVGNHIRFTPLVTGSTANGWWWFADSTCIDADTNSTFSDTFLVSGIYDIMLIIRDGHGCYDTSSHLGWIHVAKPADSFAVSPGSGCWPLNVSFIDHTTDIPGTSFTRYTWIFGDGTSSTITSAGTTHVYTAAGTYNVTEIVTDNVGCIDTVVRPNVITVYRPHAVFTASNQYPCLGQNVFFNNSSTGGIVSSFWMFGDGDTSSSNSPNHVYRTIGTYTVKLAVIDNHGCHDTATYTGYVNVTKPVAAFSASDSFTICSPITIHFFNTSTGATSYNWAFGDGATSILVSPSDLYITPNNYRVMLVATNSHGCHDTAYRNVVVYGYAGAFSYTPDSGCAPLTVHFSASLSNVPNIIWDFADGNTTVASRVDTTSHTYLYPGGYLPKLILSDNTGCRNSGLGLDTIRVDGVRPGFTTNPNPVCVNTNINFVDTSFSYFSHVNNWLWTFPDGSTSTISSPPYYFNTIGSYVVSLTATDAWGCTASGRDTITVYPPPTIKTTPDTVICVGDTGLLKASGGVSYTWTPTTTLGCPTCQNTPAFPTVQTTYTVIGTDIHGCVNSDSVTVKMRIYTVSKGWGDTDVCQTTPVQLFDTGGTKYTWIPSAGLNNSHISDPIATPDTTTRYMIIAQYGSCVPDTNYVNLIIYPLPTVDAGPSQYLVAGTVANLMATGTLIDKYKWTPGGQLSCDSTQRTVANITHTTTYMITVTSIHGCKAEDTVTIYLYCDKNQIFIPNSFTPNNDGQNDVFYPRGSGISNIKTFRIYNRWGELLFERTNISINDVSNAWDGSYNGSIPKPDVYVYLIDAVCDTGEPIFLKGDVTIIR